MEQLRLVSFLVLIFFSYGASPVVEGPDVVGIIDALRQSNEASKVHVLILHGMGVHEVGESAKLQARLVGKMGSMTKSYCENAQIPNDPVDLPADLSHAILRICEYGNEKGNSIRFYELTWSTLTKPVKDRILQYDDRDYGASREDVNRKLKLSVINYGLSDPMLYVGRYQNVLRFPIKQTICRIVQRKDNGKSCESNEHSDEVDQIFIITQSLGSAMLYDTIREMEAAGSQQEAGAESHDALTFRSKTRYIYMLANQLPLLCMSQYSGRERICEERMGPLVQPGYETNIVAISDPNDLFSFPLKSWHLDLIGLNGEPTNVLIDIAGSSLIRKLANLADPEKAHTGHADSEAVISVLACGTANGKVLEC
jgi:hypothetical protein